MAIDEAKIKEIVDKTDMIGLVGQYVELTKRGKNYFGLCPFHDDSSPSFSVSPDKKIAKCMSCGEGGNPINFLRKIKNISFEDACVELALAAGVSIDVKKHTPKVNNLNEKLYQINEMAKDFYVHYLYNTKSGQEALEYLHKRGLTDETIRKFQIGLAPKERNTLFRLLTEKGYSEIDIEDVGLAQVDKVVENGTVRKASELGYHDKFNNRIMYPIIDEQGRVVGFSGRIYYSAPDQPKYINTEETPIYKKGEMLYNLNNAISAIRKTKRVILCEGQMDVIACTNAGINETICSLGTALTENQVALIKKYAQNVIICYDGDEAGIKATKKAFKLLKDIPTKEVTLPNGMDPDEFLKAKGKDALEKYIEEEQRDVYEFCYSEAFRGRSLDSATDYENIKKDVFYFLHAVKSTTLVEKFLQRLAEDLDVSYAAIFNDYNVSGTKKKEPLVEVTQEVKIKPHEEDFLALIMFNKKYFIKYIRELGKPIDYLETEIAMRLYMAISHYYDTSDTDISNLFKYCLQEVEDDYVKTLWEKIPKYYGYDPDKIEQMIEDSVKRFKDLKFKEERGRFKVTSNNLDEKTIDTLQNKLEYVRKIINEGK